MANSENSRPTRFPKELWEVIEEDARRCKRNWNQQIEMILSVYYGLEEKEPDIDPGKILRMRGGTDKTAARQGGERVLKSIEFGKKGEVGEDSLGEEAIIYQGKAIYRQKQDQAQEKSKK